MKTQFHSPADSILLANALAALLARSASRWSALGRAARMLPLLLLLTLPAVAQAQTNYQRLKSFGFPDVSSAFPNSIIEGSEGALYGTSSGGGTGQAGTIFKLKNDGSGYTVLHHFAGNGEDGRAPWAGLVEGSDGAMYGTTGWGGGGNNFGTVFKLNKDGHEFTVLHRFEEHSEEGRNPRTSLVEGSDGALYGTTSLGGTNQGGTVFKLNKNGSGFTVLRSFDDVGHHAGLVEGSDGALYGTLVSGGINGLGMVFKLNKDGSGYIVLRSFTGSGGDGSYPAGSLVEASDGALYGTTSGGGTNDLGTMFKLNKDGSGYIVLHSVIEGEGYFPSASLVEGGDGALYGTTGERGGPVGYDAGTVFKLNKDGSGYTVLRRFTGNIVDGFGPAGGLVEGSDGTLYGATAYGGSGNDGTVFKLNKDGSGYTVVRSFARSGGDGSNPSASLVEGSDGLLYGTTFSGGTNYWGTLFKLNKDGSGYTLLRSFTTDGEGACGPVGLLEGNDGPLYGTTRSGGPDDAGTVFKLNKDGSGYTVLRSFIGSVGDGRNPRAGLVEGSDGMLYGTTGSGGTHDWGTVFKLTKNGSGYTVLHSFAGGVGDGRMPVGLLEGSDGTLYGTTSIGGATNASVSWGLGTIFKLNKNGSGYAILHRFAGSGGEGSRPNDLIEGSDGSLYGTTLEGGTVFMLSKDGSSYTVLRQFTGSGGDGRQPSSGLVEGSDGALYGTTSSGGITNVNNDSFGTVFKLNKNGSGYIVLRSFAGSGGDGSNPTEGLVEGSDGALYGTTYSGGDLDLGTVFKLFSSTPVVAATRIERTGAGVLLSFSGGVAMQTYPIHATTSLSPPTWQTIGSQTAGIDGRFQFLDTGASNHLTRFYRSLTQ